MEKFEEVISEFYGSVFFNPRLKIFLYAYAETEYDNSCRYWIYDTEEGKGWTFSTSDYDDAHEPCDRRVTWIEKRRDLWLVEDSGDESAIAQAKEALAEAEARAEEAAEEESRSDDDEEEDGED